MCFNRCSARPADAGGERRAGGDWLAVLSQRRLVARRLLPLIELCSSPCVRQPWQPGQCVIRCRLQGMKEAGGVAVLQTLYYLLYVD